MGNDQGCTNEELDLRPKALRYAEHAVMIEQMIMDVLPDVIKKLGEMAKEGNIAAARYLVDRIHGRPARLTSAATGDTTLPYTREDWTADLLRKKAKTDDQKRIDLRTISTTGPLIAKALKELRLGHCGG